MAQGQLMDVIARDSDLKTLAASAYRWDALPRSALLQTVPSLHIAMHTALPEVCCQAVKMGNYIYLPTVVDASVSARTPGWRAPLTCNMSRPANVALEHEHTLFSAKKGTERKTETESVEWGVRSFSFLAFCPNHQLKHVLACAKMQGVQDRKRSINKKGKQRFSR